MTTTTKTLFGARILFANHSIGLQEEVTYEFTTEDERDRFYNAVNQETDIINTGMYTRIVYTNAQTALNSFRDYKVRGVR
jgi:hypothetical protein